MIKALTYEEYKSTFGETMTDILHTAEPVIDIWPVIKPLMEIGIISKYVFEEEFVEYVYRNEKETFDHILIPTEDENIFVIIIVDLKNKNIYGFYKLDLNKEYGLLLKD